MNSRLDETVKLFKEKTDKYTSWLNNYINNHPNYNSIQEEQDELRNVRNAISNIYYEINGKIQKEIDNLDLKKFNIDNILNKYIKVSFNGTTYYAYVKSISRLYKGAKIHGKIFCEHIYDDNSSCTLYIKNDEEEELTIMHECYENIQIINKDEFMQALNDTLDKYINYYNV